MQKRTVDEHELSVQISNETTDNESSSVEDVKKMSSPKAKAKAKSKAKAKAKVKSKKEPVSDDEKSSSDSESKSDSDSDNDSSSDSDSDNDKPKAKAKTKAKAKVKAAAADESEDTKKVSLPKAKAKGKSKVEKTSDSVSSSSSPMKVDNKKIFKDINTDINMLGKCIKTMYMKKLEDNFDIKKTKNVFKVDVYLFIYTMYLVKNKLELPKFMQDDKEDYEKMYQVYEVLGEIQSKMMKHAPCHQNIDKHIEEKYKSKLFSKEFLLVVFQIYMHYLSQSDKYNNVFQLKRFVEITENLVKLHSMMDDRLVEYVKYNPFTKVQSKIKEKFNKFESFQS